MHDPWKASESGRARVGCPRTSAGRRGRIRAVALMAVCAAALTCTVPVPAASQRGPVVIPPVAHSYDILGAAWWRYVSAIPAQSNPLLDERGEDLRGRPAQGAAGVLPGRRVGRSIASAERTCTVPRTKALFFPLFTSCYFHAPVHARNQGVLRYAHDAAAGVG